MGFLSSKYADHAGHWWAVSSKKDPRWNASGASQGGIFGAADACDKAINALKKKYGEPPDDLTMSAGEA